MVLTSDSRTGKETPFSLPPPQQARFWFRNLGHMFTGAVYFNNRTVAWRLTVFMAFVSVIKSTRILVYYSVDLCLQSSFSRGYIIPMSISIDRTYDGLKDLRDDVPSPKPPKPPKPPGIPFNDAADLSDPRESIDFLSSVFALVPLLLVYLASTARSYDRVSRKPSSDYRSL